MGKTIGPDKVLRGIALFSLVAWGAAAIYRMKVPGYDNPHGAQLFDTVTYFFFGFLLFGLFYGQYVWVPRLLKRQLNVALGFVQTFLCLALLLFGLFPVWISDLGASVSFNPDNMLVTLAILGEALFVVNVCWTVMQPASAAVPVSWPVSKTAELAPLQAQVQPVTPLRAAKKSKFDFSRWLKPENPMEKFGITAVFLFVGGIVIWLVMPESRFLILFDGQKHFTPMGLLWWICAIPFSAFSLAYWFHARPAQRPVRQVDDETPPRAHICLAGRFCAHRNHGAGGHAFSHAGLVHG